MITERVAKRVDAQFEQGLLDEIRGLIARGVPETARPFGGLVYRQALEHLHGVRSEVDTRALIARENRHYARRQLIWFRKEPNLVWLQTSGEDPGTLAAVESILATWPTLFSRVIVIVMDSVGIGELEDAVEYGDEGSNTVGNIARQVPLQLSTLR